MSRDEARAFLQSLESFANDQIVDGDVERDLDKIIALVAKERELCANVWSGK